MAKQITSEPLAYTLAKAGDKLGLAPSTMRALVLNGTIPAVHCGKRWLIPAKALEAWLDQAAGQ